MIEAIKPGLSKRRYLAAALVLLPLPFAISTAFEIQKSGSSLAVLAGYGLISLMFACLIVQILYVSGVVDDTKPGPPTPVWKRFLWHLPGNLAVMILLELSAFVPMFASGFARNEYELGEVGVALVRSLFSVPVFALSAELWFRYFRVFSDFEVKEKIGRRTILRKYRSLFTAMFVTFTITGALPEAGIGLAISTPIDIFIGICLWEILGREFKELHRAA